MFFSNPVGKDTFTAPPVERESRDFFAPRTRASFVHSRVAFPRFLGV